MDWLPPISVGVCSLLGRTYNNRCVPHTTAVDTYSDHVGQRQRSFGDHMINSTQSRVRRLALHPAHHNSNEPLPTAEQHLQTCRVYKWR